MNNSAMEDVEGRFGRPEVMTASSNLMQKVIHEIFNLKNWFLCKDNRCLGFVNYVFFFHCICLDN
jgi:hypothetical protein